MELDVEYMQSMGMGISVGLRFLVNIYGHRSLHASAYDVVACT